MQRNDKNFYRIEVQGQELISMYKPGSSWSVIDSKKWWAEDYTVPEFEFDFSRSFFEQF